jgi:uncharacterized protein (DUF427 family)
MAAARPKGNEMRTTTADTKTPRGRIRLENGAKRVRAFLGGEVVADTVRPLLVWEVPYYPAYYFPLADVRAALRPDGGRVRSPRRGDARTFTVRSSGAEAPGAALRYEDSPIEELRDLVRLDWSAMDAWFEEDEEVFTHAATQISATGETHRRPTRRVGAAPTGAVLHERRRDRHGHPVPCIHDRARRACCRRSAPERRRLGRRGPGADGRRRPRFARCPRRQLRRHLDDS